MSCNLKVASIVIATLTITFSSLTLVRLTATFCTEGQQQNGQKNLNGGIIKPTQQLKAFSSNMPPSRVRKPVPMGKSPSFTIARNKTRQEENKDVLKEWNNRKASKNERVIGIVVTVVSILTSFMVFGAVSDNYEQNTSRRIMILPFVVFHSLVNLLNFLAICYIIVKYNQYMDVLIYSVLIYILVVFVTMVGVYFVVAYFRVLSKMGGYHYAQMDDVAPSNYDDKDTIKKPMA